MKKILSLFCAMAIVLSVSAAPQVGLTRKVAAQKIEVKQAPRLGKAVQAMKPVQSAPKATAALESGTYYTQSGSFYVYSGSSSGFVDYTSKMASIQVTVDGSNVTIVGLAYWFKEGAIQGTMNGNTITFANGQKVGTDEYGDEFLVGSTDGETISENIVFEFDAEKKTLTAKTPFLMETDGATSVSAYTYWVNPVFSAEEPEAPEAVVLPDGATVVEYVMDYTDYYGTASAATVNVAVVGNNVYFQGLSTYLTTAWVVGTKEGNTITFAKDQYLGEYYDEYPCYAFNNGETVFTYDADADKYSATGTIYGLVTVGTSNYYDGYYVNPVLSKVKDADLDHPIEVVIANGTHKYDSEYKDVIYTLSNATEDTIFVFDIKLAEGNDVVSGTTYTLEDMYADATYTYVQIGEASSGLKSVSFVKTLSDAGVTTIEATVVDVKANVFHLTGSFEEVIPTPVVAPEGLETSSYKFEGTDSYTAKAASFQVLVGFDGSDVYIQGLSKYLPEAWVKGALAAGVVTIPETYLGVYESWFEDYELTFAATTMAYDAENDKFTCAEYYTTSGGYKMDEYENVTLTKLNEVAATPVEPEITEFAVDGETYPKVRFNISLTGTNGEELLESKTSYIFYVQKGNESSPLELTTDLYEELEANMTEIPYTFSDDYDIYNTILYLNQGETELRSWDKLGLQTIYRGGGEEHKSTINWFNVRAYWAEVDGDETGVEDVNAALKTVKRIENGQLIIRKNGKNFNAQGVEVR